VKMKKGKNCLYSQTWSLDQNARVFFWLSGSSPSLTGSQRSQPLARSFPGGGVSSSRADSPARSTKGRRYLSGDLSAPISWGAVMEHKFKVSIDGPPLPLLSNLVNFPLHSPPEWPNEDNLDVWREHREAKESKEYVTGKRMLSLRDQRRKEKDQIKPKKKEKTPVHSRKEKSLKPCFFFQYDTQPGAPYHILVDTNFINFSIKAKLDLGIQENHYENWGKKRRVAVLGGHYFSNLDDQLGLKAPVPIGPQPPICKDPREDEW
ncbi:hypothetical protein MC885_013336, partial [Smutsia gigantea]